MPNAGLPNPNARRRNKPSLGDWVDLPERNPNPTPKAPVGAQLTGVARTWWQGAWKLGVASMWREDDLWMVVRRAHLERAIVASNWSTTSLLAEARQTDAVLGISAEGRKSKRWRYPGEFGAGLALDEDDEPLPAGVVDLTSRTRRKRSG